MALSACSGRPPFFPIQDYERRFEFEGFSFLPPSGVNWGAVGHEFPSMPFNMMKDTGNRYHTLAATAEIGILDDAIIEKNNGDTKKLLAFVAQDSIDIQLRMDKKNNRFSLVEFKKKETTVDGNSCLSWNFKFEDRGVPGKKGVLFFLAGESLACLHPDSPAMAIALQYSERYQADTSPQLHFFEGRRFLSSLALTPMDYKITAIRVGRRPQEPYLGHGSIWVSSRKSDQVHRIDPRTNKIQAEITVGGNPRGIVAVPGGVWVANTRSRTLSFINAQSNKVMKSVDVGGYPNSLGIHENLVMICNAPSGKVSLLDTETNTVSAAILVMPYRRLFWCGQVGSEFWASIGYSILGHIARVDLKKREVSSRIRFLPGPTTSVLLHNGIAWVAFRNKGVVAGIDPETEDTIFKIATGPRPVSLASFDDMMWVGDLRNGTIVRIDPQSRTVTGKPLAFGPAPVGMLAAEGSLWVTKVYSGQLLRITAK